MPILVINSRVDWNQNQTVEGLKLTKWEGVCVKRFRDLVCWMKKNNDYDEKNFWNFVEAKWVINRFLKVLVKNLQHYISNWFQMKNSAFTIHLLATITIFRNQVTEKIGSEIHILPLEMYDIKRPNLSVNKRFQNTPATRHPLLHVLLKLITIK